MKIFHVFLAAALVFGTAHAEQGCSDGFRPGINAQGFHGCIPGGNSTSGDQGAVNERWENRYGAVAMDLAGKTGVAGNASSKWRAEKEALSRCQAKGGSDCKIDIWYRNACVVVAAGPKPASSLYVTVSASAESVSMASEMALEGCRKGSPACEVFFSDCSFPVRTR